MWDFSHRRRHFVLGLSSGAKPTTSVGAGRRPPVHVLPLDDTHKVPMMVGRMASQARNSADPVPGVVWLNPQQESFAGDVVRAAGIDVVAAGCPGTRRAPAPASLLGVTPTDDFRRTIADHADTALIVLAADADVRDALTHPDSLARGVADSHAPIYTTEPLAGSLNALARLHGEHPKFSARVHRIPTFAAAPGFVATLASLESFGVPRSLDLACRASRGSISLGGLLLGAMEFVVSTLGEPESMDASISGLDALAGLRLAPGETLDRIAGDLSAHLRFADGRSAAVSLSDQGGAWFRGATILGAGGCIRADDRSMSRTDATGEEIDESAPDGATQVGLAGLLVREIRGRLEGRIIATPDVRLEAAYALAEAALLSARTGQPEYPATIRRMAGVV